MLALSVLVARRLAPGSSLISVHPQTNPGMGKRQVSKSGNAVRSHD